MKTSASIENLLIKCWTAVWNGCDNLNLYNKIARLSEEYDKVVKAENKAAALIETES
jgi:hypothetical protein